MVIPDWRPMPDTSMFDRKDPEQVRQAAAIRVRHRCIMAVRWRDVAAREQDRALDRLAIDWHDWMNCPGVDGYGSWKCTCDTWALRAQTQKKRRELRRNADRAHHNRVCRPGTDEPYVVALGVKTIDLGLSMPIVISHDQSNLFMGDKKAVSVRSNEGGRRSSDACYPSWARGERCRLPGVRA
jgi:hypothetical protein